MSTGIKPIMPASHTAITTKREKTPAFTKSRTLNLFTYKNLHQYTNSSESLELSIIFA